MENKKTVTSTTSTSATLSTMNLDDLNSTMETLVGRHHRSLLEQMSGVLVIEDRIGAMVGPNQYAFVVGSKLYAQLQALKK